MIETGRQRRTPASTTIGLLTRLFADETAGMSLALTLMIIPMVGLFGLATEASSWFLIQRSMQNAADSAAVAAATNKCDATIATCVNAGGAFYDAEAKAVAREFGFIDGQANTTITATNTAPCPDTGEDECYGVTITRQLPIYLVKLVGFNGDADLGDGVRGQTVRAYAVASSTASSASYCITAIGSGVDAIDINGAGGGGVAVDFGGCSFLVPNGGASCTKKAGTETNIGYADVWNTGDNKDCGTERPIDQSADPFDDPYDGLVSNIPTDTCPSSGGYPQNIKGDVAADHQFSGSRVFTGADSQKCGDIKLSGDLTITADSVLYIYGGRLDLAGNRLSTANGAHLTIVFTGPSGTGDHIVMSTKNGAVLDYAAPESGPWSGIAIYQDPGLTSNVDMTYSGSNPEFNLTGMIYAKNAEITISGAIDHATAGYACLAFFAETVTISGTVAIFAQPTIECDRAGLTLPYTGGIGSARAALVQ